METSASCFIEPICANARWARMDHFLSVRLSLHQNSQEKKSFGLGKN